jgi:chemotaxis protein methyltransferase CheR
MPESNLEIELQLLLEAIYLKYNYDFREYSRSSLKRRIRHALRVLECSTVSMLQDRILREPGAFMQLLQYLTIPVSEMFRDPGAAPAGAAGFAHLSIIEDLDRRLQYR